MSTEAATVPREEEFIDLRAAINVLIRRWRLIAAVVSLALAGAVVSILLAEPEYTAVSSVALIKNKSQVEFDERFQTVSDADLASAGGVVNLIARRNAMLELVHNVAIAERVSERLAEQYPAEDVRPSALMSKVNASYAGPNPDQSSDLLQIQVTESDPALAADIATAWGLEYEAYINDLFSGAPTEYSSSVDQTLAEAWEEYEAAEAEVLEFVQNDEIRALQGELDEKTAALSTLRAARATAVGALFEEQVNSQIGSIRALLQAESENRILAFTRGQEARRQILSSYVEAELQNRMAVINRDRQLRLQIFQRVLEAEISGKLSVFDAQLAEKSGALSNAYAEQRRLEQLIADAQIMRAQVAEGGDAAAESNRLALLILKSEAFAARGNLPGNLQLDISAAEVPATAAEQIQDLDAVVAVLQPRLASVEQRLQEISSELLAGTGYDFLEDLSADTLTFSASDPSSEEGSLASFINERYADLFEVGTLAQQAEEIAEDSPLFAHIEEFYPTLFERDAMMDLANSIPDDNPLNLMAQGRAEELLQFTGYESLLRSSVAAAQPLTLEIQALSDEIRDLEAQIHSLTTIRKQLDQRRDLAWETYGTLSRKQAELGISTAVTGSEVRFASPAYAIRSDTSPILILLVAAFIGTVLGVMVAYLLEYLVPGISPQRLVGPPERAWNRAYRWIMAPAPGLPPRPAASGAQQATAPGGYD